MEKQGSLLQSSGNTSLRSQLKSLGSRPMRITLIIAVTIAITQQATGINAILFYAPTVFEQIGVGTDAAFVQAIWIGLTSIVFTVFSILLIDRLGRRPLIIWGLVWIVLSLGICSYGFKNAEYVITDQTMQELADIPSIDRLSLLSGENFDSDIDFKSAISSALGEEDARKYAGLLLQKAAKMNVGLILFGILSFIAAFHFSIGPIMWVLFSEIFPITLRGIAIPVFALLSSLVNYLVQQFFPWQLATMGISAIFLFYASMVFVGIIILFRFLPETKNLSIEDIQLKLEPG